MSDLTLWNECIARETKKIRSLRSQRGAVNRKINTVRESDPHLITKAAALVMAEGFKASQLDISSDELGHDPETLKRVLELLEKQSLLQKEEDAAVKELAKYQQFLQDELKAEKRPPERKRPEMAQKKRLSFQDYYDKCASPDIRDLLDRVGWMMRATFSLCQALEKPRLDKFDKDQMVTLLQYARDMVNLSERIFKPALEPKETKVQTQEKPNTPEQVKA